MGRPRRPWASCSVGVLAGGHIRFEARESGVVETSAEFKHAKWTGDQRHFFLCGEGKRFRLGLFAAHKNDCTKLSDLCGPYNLRVGQAGKQDSLRLAGGKDIAHQVRSAGTADFYIHVYLGIKSYSLGYFNNVLQIHGIKILSLDVVKLL